MELQGLWRDILVKHLEGPQQRIPHCGRQARTIFAMLRRGLLRYDRPKIPRSTIITPRGKAVLKHSLQEWMEAALKFELSGNSANKERHTVLQEDRKAANDKGRNHHPSNLANAADR